jgi:hypothetical protein
VRWGYNNVRVKDRDQWKAAFKTNKGLFKPTVMFFGMLLCIISPNPFSHTHPFRCFCYFCYLHHSVHSVHVPSHPVNSLIFHYLSPLGSGRILHGSCYVLIVYNAFTFLSLILLLFHYSVHLRYCYPSPYISVIVIRLR